MTELKFKGKSSVYAHHLTVPILPLCKIRTKSLSNASKPDGCIDDNLIIQGDNLLALKALLPNYAGKVDCVYIDPPYNTGRECWEYNDNVNSEIIKDWFNKKIGIDDIERHDKWLCMMWPRLSLLRDLLSENGFIFISIDDNECHRLRMIMDEIFGNGCFVSDIIWKHRKSTQNDINVSLSHNHILVYSKRPNQQMQGIHKNDLSVWDDVGTATNGTQELQTILGEKLFATPKPSDLIMKVLKISTDKNSVILDSFAGSGTTGHATLALNKDDGGNRKFILVECEKDYIHKVTCERIRRVIRGVPQSKNEHVKNGLGGSFSFYELGKDENGISINNLPSHSELSRNLLRTAIGVSILKKSVVKREGWLFYEDSTRLFFLVYKPDLKFLRSERSVLGIRIAKEIEGMADKSKKKAIVFATREIVGNNRLTSMGIIFCNLPFSVF